MKQIRLPGDILEVVGAMQQPNGMYPKYQERSAVHIACELIRTAPEFLQAKRQAASERHPRPGQPAKK